MPASVPKSVKVSAGLLLYRAREGGALEVLLGHPGGPFWAKKDQGAWSLPKGEVEAGEALLVAARRETLEETGLSPEGPFVPLGSVTLRSGKVVHAWAAHHDADVTGVGRSTVTLEYPPRSGRTVTFPELDRLSFFAIAMARWKANPAQVAFFDRLVEALASRDS